MVYSLPELRRILSPVFAEYGVHRAILFGSYAKGCATERSDVDILVDSGLRGLAKTSLSGEAKDQLSSIPWRQLYGMRNGIVHGYEGVNMRIVWDTAAEDIPELQRELAASLSKLEP